VATASLNGHARNAALLIGAFFALRVIVAAVTELNYDEAYYWVWSQHLAMGYYDHPPGVALLIRAGTIIGGATPFGVRIASLIGSLAMSFAVYRSAEVLFDSKRAAATAAVLLNATLLVAGGTLIVTPDAPLLIASSFVLYCLARIGKTGRGGWWLATGFAVGVGLVSKYTALFFGLSILLWLALVPELRRWFLSPWPYLGGLVALLAFSPVIVWNAQNHWVSFVKQFGRAGLGEGLSPHYVGELIPAQIGFATPLVFILGVSGIYALATRKAEVARWARVLIHASFWPVLIYFAWHALHARVDPNWLGPIYPSFAIAGAFAAECYVWPRGQRLIDACRRWALPFTMLLFVAAAVQVNTGILTGYARDPSVHKMAVGSREVARAIDAVRAQVGASCVLTTDHTEAAWLMFYLAKGTCVAQRGERYRWTYMAEPDEAQLRGPLLYVIAAGAGNVPGNPIVEEYALKQDFPRIARVATVVRERGPLVVEPYGLDVLGESGDKVFDRSPPPELEPAR
jgi:4-amino-4-deoxy-L-arabinose transferase-like glycosyltransferase